MLATVKKKISSINPGFVVVIALLVMALIVGIMSSERTVPASTDKLGYTLVIDAGHGGIDGGAIGADGTKESEINLAVARRLRALAEFYGCDNCMIRSDDSTKCDSESYSERRDLECRAEITEGNNNPVYISIHQNFYPTGQPSGVQVLYSSSENSRDFARLTQANLIENLLPECRRVAEPAGDSVFVLARLSCPAILIECGFMSNYSELERLKNADYQTQLASVMMASYIQFVSQYQKI